MKLIRSLHEFDRPAGQKSVLTIGSYDGLHRGHQAIVRQLQESAQCCQAATVLISFYPHPKVTLQPNLDLKYLTTLPEKLMLLKKFGVDVAAILPFNHNVAQTSAYQFVQQLVNAFDPVELWVGPDFKLGKDGAGTVDYLKSVSAEFGFSVHVIEWLLAENGETISSTRIRQSLATGDVKRVTHWLGYAPFLLGKVVAGAQRGRTIGFPTANIAVPVEKLLPANGVYAVRLKLADDVYPAVANIGVRPTFDGGEPTVEVHIFDFDRQIYGQTVQVDLIDFLRPEQKFDGLEALVAQINCDVRQAKAVLQPANP